MFVALGTTVVTTTSEHVRAKGGSDVVSDFGAHDFFNGTDDLLLTRACASVALYVLSMNRENRSFGVGLDTRDELKILWCIINWTGGKTRVDLYSLIWQYCVACGIHARHS